METRLITELPDVEDLVLLQPIPVSFEFDDEGCILSHFADARIWYGGDDVDDAFVSMREMVLMSFRTLSRYPDEKLGVKMKNQKYALLRYLAWAETAVAW